MSVEIVRHYGDGRSMARIVAGLEAAGLDLERATVDDLAPVDEFHIGGRGATRELVTLAGFPAGSRLLDVGAGIGGTARLLAADHEVVGVDVTAEYVDVARALTDTVAPDARVEFVHADACSLPLESSSFDGAVQLHVGMNLHDKAAVFGEVARVLRPGGVFAIYDIVAGPDGAVDYPVPWAADERSSHLAPPETYEALLVEAGFTIARTDDLRRFALTFFDRLDTRRGPPPAIGLHLLMGDEAPLRYGNMVAAVRRGAIWPQRWIARRGG